MQTHFPLTLKDVPWVDQAACQDHDPALFFPPRGGDTRQALAVCRECDVRPECLAYALEAGERFGIWGGTTQRERRRLLLRRKLERSA